MNDENIDRVQGIGGEGDDVRQRRPPRRLDGTTNGHPPPLEDAAGPTGGDQLDEDEAHHSITSSEEEQEYGQDPQSPLAERRSRTSRLQRARLRFSTPEQLLQFHDADVLRHLAWCILVFRIINALITSRTMFAPDEHWQSLEVAHAFVFDGMGWITWEWGDRRPQSERAWGAHWGDGPIRSFLYPAMFVPGYWLLKMTRLDNTRLLTLFPSILQALFATLTDVYTFKLASRIVNDRAAWATLVSLLASMYTFHTTTRTLSNSVEAAFTVVALFYWPLTIPADADSDMVGTLPLVEGRELFQAVALFALSTALRPSNILLSLPLTASLLRQLAKHVRSAGSALEAGFALLTIVRTITVVGIITLALLTAIDSMYFGRLTLTPLAFLKRNVLQGISLFYGASPLHFYASSALPFIAFTLLPFTLWGWAFALANPSIAGFDKDRRRWFGYRGERDPAAIHTLGQATFFFVLSMSLLGHKEVRFLQPIVPVLHIYTGYSLALLPRISWAGAFALIPRRLHAHASRWHQPHPGVGSDGEDAPQQARLERAQRASLLRSLAAFTSWQGRQHLLPARPSVRSQFGTFSATLRDVCRRHGRWAVGLLLANIPAAFYLSVHSSGQVRMAEDVGALSRAGVVESVGFLMPCHSTPWQSHMHARALAASSNGSKSAWFITCEPPLDGQDLRTYRDESDDFYANPYGFLVERMVEAQGSSSSSSSSSSSHEQHTWPSHLVVFEALLGEQQRTAHHKSEQTIEDLLRARGYVCATSYWNSLVHLDRRRRGRVLLFERRSLSTRRGV